MDFLKLIEDKDIVSFAENYSYDKNYMGQKLFPMQKTDNLKVSAKMLMEGGDIPVMAQVHAFDSEARIGDRPNYIEVKAEKLLIKEKINQTERLMYFLNDGASKDKLKDYIYDDMSNLLSRVITRTEVMNMEVLATGAITINENNATYNVDFGLPNSHKVVLNDWSNPEHDIIGDLTQIKSKAKTLGVNILRAITSEKVMNLMLRNEAIAQLFSMRLSSEVMTMGALKAWLLANFDIEFVTNDDVYKTSASGSTLHRFFPEDVITFLGTRAAFGTGLFCVTPSELMDIGVNGNERAMCYIKRWANNDPAGIWTLVEGVYLPVPKNINNMVIATVA